MTLITTIIGLAAAAVLALIANGLIMWKQQGILKNDVDHLKQLNERLEKCLSGIKTDLAKLRTDIKWLISRSTEQ